MPIPQTRVVLSSAIASGGGVRFLPNAAGDLALAAGTLAAPWLGSIADLNGDARPDFIFGASGDDDKALDAGRVVVRLGALTNGSTVTLTDGTADIIIDGVNAGDHAGASVGSIGDLDGDGLGEILIGAPGMNVGAAADAGVAFVVWGMNAPGGVDLNDPFTGSGGGYAIRGQAAGDAAGTTVLSVTDMNGDGLQDVIVGAPGNDAGGADAGAVYVVWGRNAETPVNLSAVAAGNGGFRIIGEDGGDAVGRVVSTIADLNGDGLSEILIGAADNNASGQNAGAVFVVFGKANGATVDLTNVSAGVGGFRISGVADDDAGAAVSSIGDVNGDGLADILIGAPRSDSAYVVFGKADTTEIDLNDVRAGVGGFHIQAQGIGDLDSITVTGGADLNRDGIADFVIGAPNNSEGGSDGGAVYVVWGGRFTSGTVDLNLIAQGIGGAKIVGPVGSLTGSAVSIVADANGDGTADLLIGAPGTGESAYLLYSPTSWQPDNNIYGTNGNDVIGAGYGGVHPVGETDDVILGLGGNDTINGAGGADTIEGGAGNDILRGDDGNDWIDGGLGTDTMTGGLGDDTFIVDNALDVTIEAVDGGIDTVRASVNYTLTGQTENLILTGAARTGIGNTLANSLTGTAGDDLLDGAGNADTLTGGAGNDTYVVDTTSDVIVEGANAGTDTVRSSVNWTLADNLENLELSGAALRGTGNAAANRITGNAFDNVLNGMAGADTMIGAGGNDSYTVDTLGDVVVEVAGQGVDTVNAGIDGYTLAANVEVLRLTGTARIGNGNAADNSLIGTNGDDTLNGGAGNDVMEGGIGNDTYIVDTLGDTIMEQPFGANAGGIDTIVASIDYDLGTSNGNNIERLTLTGAARVGTGNAADNVITGTTGNDTLNGAGGVDTLIGGAGNDTYLVDTTTDILTELAGEGTDTVIASVDYALAEGNNIENLTLTGAATHGTGNSGDNVLTGTAAADILEGMAGNDRLDGGAGADSMVGGAGDDTYILDDAGDVVVEAVDGGIDTIIVNANVTTIAANIENVILSGSANSATGNSGNNAITGSGNDDTLDGAEGDDTLTGGEGDDTLHSHSGNDRLSGGGGDDRYVISGGSVTIEDFLGHDTIDCSDSIDDNYVDLSGETQSVIDDHGCDLGQGGTTFSPLDIQFLQDRSGSFGDDIATVRGLVPSIVSAIQLVQANSQFGVSSFIDKPVSPFGAPGEWVYLQELALSSNPAALTNIYNTMTVLSGADGNEAQIEGLMQLALHAGDVGFRADAARFVVLFTDAPFHVAGDGALAGITTPNNGDAFTPGNGALEDYPTINQLSAALVAANIIPIFAVAGGVEATYQQLTQTLGRGAVVTLTGNSSNIVAAISQGLTAATTTHIEDCDGGSGHDTILGGVEDNGLSGNDGDDSLDGRSGNDHLSGGRGNDTVHGGDGEDTLELSGSWLDYDFSTAGAGYTVSDGRVSGDGTDSFDGIEKVQFGTQVFALADVLNVGPVGVDDTGTALVEASGTDAGVASANGNVLTNDTDGNLAVSGLGEVLSVAAARTGAAADGGAMTPLSGSLVLQGLYGALTLNADGSYSYALDNGLAATQALNTGDTATERFTYQVTDAHGAMSEATLSFAISGANDGPPATVNAVNDRVNVTIGQASAIDAAALLSNDTVSAPETLSVTSVSNAVGASVALVNGQLVITASGASASFDYTTTSASGGTDVGHVIIGGLASDALANTMTATTTSAAADLQGQDGNDTLRGGNGIDHIVGGNGADSLFGRGGMDVLLGGAGIDRLDGGLGADRMEGGADNDTYTVDDAGDVVVEAFGEGTADAVTARINAYSLTDNVERLTFAGTGDFVGTGNALANFITGGAGNDVLDGGLGNDRLTGGSGDDVLIGGGGIDTLTGGVGADTFRFADFADMGRTTPTADTISDFSFAQGDRIDLSLLDANSLLAGDQAFTFIGNAAFSHTAGELRMSSTATLTMISGDVDGDGIADFVLKMTGVQPVTADWFHP